VNQIHKPRSIPGRSKLKRVRANLVNEGRPPVRYFLRRRNKVLFVGGSNWKSIVARRIGGYFGVVLLARHASSEAFCESV